MAARETIPESWDQIMDDVIEKYQMLIEKRKSELKTNRTGYFTRRHWRAEL